MKNSIRILTALLLVFMLQPAMASDPFVACAEDIKASCADVVPGDGRVLSCLYAHTATLSDACHAATNGIGALLEGFFDRLNDVYDACRDDLQNACAANEAGNDKLACLTAQKDSLSTGCRAALDGI